MLDGDVRQNIVFGDCSRSEQWSVSLAFLCLQLLLLLLLLCVSIIMFLLIQYNTMLQTIYIFKYTLFLKLNNILMYKIIDVNRNTNNKRIEYK
jgi:hypothetical protein